MIKETDYKNKAVLPTGDGDQEIVQKQNFLFPTYGIIVEANDIAEAEVLLKEKLLTTEQNLENK